MDLFVWLAVAISFFWAVLTFIQRRKKANGRGAGSSQQVVSVGVQPSVAPDSAPDRIVIGQTPSAPLVTIQVLPNAAAFEYAKPLEAHSSKPISRLNALMQAVPSMLVAGEAHGKNLMEVIINGDLVRAADGNGLRPFAMSGGKITEQAKLFEVDKLQNVINSAALWQIASVVVAQKHLADISQKLDEIKDGVNGISEFLDSQRRARIQGTYDYLGQVYTALRGGDLPDAVRTELESCERDMLEIQHHLVIECQQKIDEKIEHSETFGTEDLTNDIRRKISELEKITKDITLCMKTRIAAWHVLSLFPGDPHLKVARKQSIEKSISSFADVEKKLNVIFSEITKIRSFWNKESTLEERKTSLRTQCQAAASVLRRDASMGMYQISKSESLLLKHDQPTRFIIQIENGQLIEARHAV